MTAYGAGGTFTYGSLFGDAPGLYGALGAVSEPPVVEAPPEESRPGGRIVWPGETRRVTHLPIQSFAFYRTWITLVSRPAVPYPMFRPSMVAWDAWNDDQDFLDLLDLIERLEL